VTVAALRSGPFRVYFAGQVVSLSGTWMHLVAQRWLVWDMAHDEVVVGSIAAAGYAATLAFSFLGGVASDRFDRRRLMIVTQIAALVLSAALGALCLIGYPRLWEVTVVVVGLGALNAFDLPARHALVADLVPADALASAVAMNQLLFNVARAVGPAIAGVLLARTAIGVGGVFLLNAASYLAIIVPLLSLPVVRGPSAPASDARFSDGLRFVARARTVAGVLLLVLAAGTFGWSVPIMLPAFAGRTLAGGPGLYGTLTSAIAGGAIAGALLLAWASRAPKLVVIPCGLAVWCGALLAASFARGHASAIALFAVAGLGMILFTGTSNLLVQSTAPDELRGRAMGVWSTVYAIAEPIGSVEAGVTARVLGPASAIRLSAAAMAGAGAIWLALTRRRTA